MTLTGRRTTESPASREEVWVDLYDLMRARESIRSYDPDRPVSPEVLQRILEAGRLAPSAANRQPWRFLVVSSGVMLERVRPCYPRPWFEAAPHVLVVVGREEEAWVRAKDGYNSLETDLTIAMDHMILAAEYEGVGTCWIAAFDPDILREALSLRKGEKVFAITPLGYLPPGASKKGNKRRKAMEEVVRYL
ncbi:MAG: nitroreductase family protein [bacterium]|nr:MAG: nitroreductase family protein [bacterium]